ncbi:MAG: hypothetical protein JO265_00240 [Acidimicrobiia bacterium]|nr:hypothetical protein [Acidimicrobiia bacterium]
MGAEEPSRAQQRAWTLPAAAGLAALEATVTISVLLYGSHLGRPLFLVVLALKYPICWMLLRRQAWAFLALLLWEFTVAFAAVFAPRIALPLRFVELGFAASVAVLLVTSAHLFPRAQLPRR